MALIWIDGFEHYPNAASLLDGAYAEADSVSFAGGRTGARSVNLGLTLASLRKVFPGNRTEIGVGFAIFMTALPTTVNIPLGKLFDQNLAGHMAFSVTSTGAIQVRRGSYSGALLYQSDPILTANAWHHVEYYVKFDSVAGEFGLAVNNDVIVELDGQNTVNTAVISAAQIRFSNADVNIVPNQPTYYIDDLFIRDGTGANNNTGFVGDRQVIALLPSGMGADSAWTPSAGLGANQYQMVDEGIANDADYISAANAGDKSAFTLTDMSLDITDVAGIMTVVRQRKSDAGLGKSQVALISNGDVALGADRSITTAWTFWTDIVELDPDTGVKWTPPSVNAMNFRIERTL